MSITSAASAYPDLGPGQSATGVSSFALHVASDVPCGTLVNLRLRATASGGTFVDDFSLAVGSQVTSTVTHESLDVPRTIPDNATVTSSLAVASSGALLDADVGLTATHTYDGDLGIFLIGPDGTRVELTTGNGSSGDSYTSTVLDDEASTPITAGAAPFTGSYRPEGSLAALDGLAQNGTWTLEITDGATGDTGTLTAWSLILSAQSQGACNVCNLAMPAEVPSFHWTSAESVAWSATPNADFFYVYRGDRTDMAKLLDASIDSCTRAGTASLAFSGISERPAAGALLWYLARGSGPAGLGPAGNATAGPRILDSSGPCP